MSFRRRLTAFFLLIVVLPMVGVAVLVTQVSGRSQTGKADARLAAGIETALSAYRSATEAAGEGLREAGADPRVERALGAGRALSRARLGAIARGAGLRSLALLSPDGAELARVGPAAAVAAGELTLRGERGALGSLVGSVTSPTAFARTVRELTGREVAVSLGGRALATTLPLGDVALPAPGSAETVELGGSERRAASAQLAGPGARDPILTLVGPLEEARAVRPLVAAALAGFFAIALLFIVVLLRALQGQIATMLHAARRIGGGDFSRTVPVEGDDEMAGLAREFNKMSGRLAAQVDALHRQRDELNESVRRIGDAFASGLDRSALLEIVAETAVSACEADYARVHLAHAPDGGIEAGPAPAGESRGALRAAEEAALRRGGLAEARRGTAHALAHPLSGVDDGAEPGVMSVCRDDGPAFSPEQHEVLRYLVGQASVSIENISLHEQVSEQAVTDELTGLSNNRALRRWLDTEVDRAGRFGHRLSFLLLDLDDFKQVNDTHGHLQGDEVLRTVGRVLRRESRGIDEPARYGGEEFAVGLPETGPEGAAEVAGRVRARMEATDIPMVEGEAGRTMRVTASVGVATLPDCAADARELVAAADEALYRAKAGGKNRVEQAPGGAAAAKGEGQARRT